jgi:uncharacterized membrane protein
MVIAVLALIGIAWLLLPLIALLRSWQTGRELRDIRRHLAYLEGRMNATDPLAARRDASPAPPIHPQPAAEPAAPAPNPVPVSTPTAPPAPALPEWSRIPPPRTAAASSASRGFDLEERIGGRWLQHAGLIVLLLGIAFFLRYAFEHDWLSPAIRVALGMAGGVAMATGGVRLSVRYRAYGLLLAGGGIAALYLSVYAALNLYALFGSGLAFALLIAITAAAAALADRTGSQAIALVAVCGGFATPFLVGGGSNQQLRLFSYVALLIGATMYLAHRRRWRWLNVVSLGLTMLTVAVWATAYYTDAGYLRTELFLTLYCAMFVDILRRSWSTAPRDRIFVTTLTAGPVAYHVWSVVALTPHGLAFLIYLIAVTAIAVMLGVHARSTLVRLAAFVAVALPLGAWIEAHHWRGWVLTSCVAIVGIYAIHLAAQLRAVAGEHDDEFDGREVALLHANGVGVYVALYQVLIDTFSIGQFAALGVLWAFVNAAIWSVVRRTRPLPALHWLGVACTLTTAAVWLQFGGPWAVAIWATEGAVVLWIAVVSGSRWLRIGAWVLLALAAFRWGQSDIQQTTTAYVLLFNARALTGLYLVALLYFAAWKSAAQERAVLTICASIVTLIVISMEIVSFWTLGNESADALVAREMMLSASWVAYAAVLVVFGMRRRYAPIRYFAIALFGIALLKVFLVDLETLGGIYRVAGFLVVGLILLVVSFLYQRNAAKEEMTEGRT